MTLGDFANVPVDGHYQLVYVVFNTFFALLSQQAQLRCFRNVAEHLTEEEAAKELDTSRIITRCLLPRA